MIAAGLVSAKELGRLLRPDRPLTQQTISNWLRKGSFPAGAVEFRGRRAYYSVPRLIAAGWLMEVSHAGEH